jgi:hypothetical protein
MEDLSKWMALRRQLETEIGCAKENKAAFLAEGDVEDTFLKSILDDYVPANSDYITRLETLLKRVNIKIKGGCKHQYEEDDIDVDCEKSMKVTYCTICFSTFLSV